MGKYARLVTRWTPAEIDKLEDELKTGQIHPRDMKMKLAHEIVATLYGEADAAAAQEMFVRTIQQHEFPEDMPVYKLKGGETILDVLVEASLASSKGKGRRLIEQHGVRLDGEFLSDPLAAFPHPGVLQVGKRRFLRVA